MDRHPCHIFSNSDDPQGAQGSGTKRARLRHDCVARGNVGTTGRKGSDQSFPRANQVTSHYIPSFQWVPSNPVLKLQRSSSESLSLEEQTRGRQPSYRESVRQRKAPSFTEERVPRKRYVVQLFVSLRIWSHFRPGQT